MPKRKIKNGNRDWHAKTSGLERKFWKSLKGDWTAGVPRRSWCDRLAPHCQNADGQPLGLQRPEFFDGLHVDRSGQRHLWRLSVSCYRPKRRWPSRRSILSASRIGRFAHATLAVALA